MEKTWRGCGPFNKSPFIELLQLLQIYIIWRVFTFFFFDILKFTIGFPTNCWQILNWPISINFHPLFQFYYLQCVILGWQQPFLLQWESDVRESFSSSFFELRLNAVFDQIMWWLFFTRLWKFETILQPSKRFSSCEKFSPLGFCLLTNHSSCRDWITDKYIGAYFWFWITSSIASWFIFISL